MLACAVVFATIPALAGAQLPPPPSLPSPPTSPSGGSVTNPTNPPTTPPPVTTPSVTVPSVTTPSLPAPTTPATPSGSTPTTTTPSVTVDPSTPQGTVNSVTTTATNTTGTVTNAVTNSGDRTSNNPGGNTTNQVGDAVSGTLGGLSGASPRTNTTVTAPRAPDASGVLSSPAPAGNSGARPTGGGQNHPAAGPGDSPLPVVGPDGAFAQPGSNLALGGGSVDPQIGVLGVAGAATPAALFSAPDPDGLLSPAELVSGIAPLAASGGGGGGGAHGVVTDVSHAVSSVVAHLPDWSRPIIAALLVLLLLFATQSWRTSRRMRKASRQNKYMQDALVPDPPAEIAGLALSGYYRPADEVAQGGDFYDAFALDDQRVAILLGDVSGHDLRALERSNEVRHMLRTLIEECYEEGWELRRALEKASRALSKRWLEGDFVTAVVAIYDADAGTLTYSCAGHPAPVLEGDAAHDPVSVCSSPALGWGLPTGRRQTTIAFGEGDTACFFTDGLIEARVKGDFLGREGLERLVADLGATGTAKDLLRSVIRLSHEADDDLAALVVRSAAPVRSRALRVEELEFEAHDVHRRAPERFLAACDAPAEVIERLASVAQALTAVGGGRAVLRVEVDPAFGVTDATIEPIDAPVRRHAVTV